MPHLEGFKENGPGHYYATIHGTRYEARIQRRDVAPKITWMLSHVVDGRLEPLREAPTLGAHRAFLAELAGWSTPAPRHRRPLREVVSREWIQLDALSADLAVAGDQAERIELPDVQRVLGIARRAIADALSRTERVVRREPIPVDVDEDALEWAAA